MKKTKGFLFFLVAVMALITLSACSLEAPAEEETKPVMPVLQNDLEKGALVIESVIEGEDIKVKRSYSTPYNAKKWRITDSKNLKMQAWASAPEGTVVLVEHVHAAVCLQSKRQDLDGWPQAEMDDKLHVGSQPGFLVNERYPYENVFAITGFSQTLVDGWGYASGSYGVMSISESRLTEDSLVEYGGVYGNKIQVVYDLLIKNKGDEYFHTRSFIDEFLVQVAPK